jgi:hypothetical protein
MRSCRLSVLYFELFRVKPPAVLETSPMRRRGSSSRPKCDVGISVFESRVALRRCDQVEHCQRLGMPDVPMVPGQGAVSDLADKAIP